MLRQRDNVHVPLDDNRRIFLAQCGARLRQAKQLAPFLKQWRFRRVQILRFTFAQYAPTKSDHLTFRIHDWKHDPVAKTVVQPSLLVLDDQADGLQFRLRVVVERRAQILPPVRGIADPELLGNLTGQASPLEIANRLVRMLKLFVVILRGPHHQICQRGELGTVVRPAPLIFGDLQTDASGQLLDRVDEPQTRILHEKTDGRTVRTTAKTVIKLLGRTHGKRWRLLVMEWATC